MTLYRYATLNERDRWAPGPPPAGGFSFYDDEGEVMSYFVPVVVTEHIVLCFDCRGLGWVVEDSMCDGCKGTGHWAVPVVVDKDSI